MIEAQQEQIANLKKEVARTSTLLEASREAHAALASNTLKLEDKLTRCSAKIDTLQNIIQENSARDESRFTAFTKMLEDVRVSSASVGRPAREIMATLIQEALRAWVDNEYVPILQNTVAEAMHQAKDVATKDKMDTTQGQ
jgi:predicted alternative tryptophan synthase beta-subunit